MFLRVFPSFPPEGTGAGGKVSVRRRAGAAVLPVAFTCFESPPGTHIFPEKLALRTRFPACRERAPWAPRPGVSLDPGSASTPGPDRTVQHVSVWLCNLVFSEAQLLASRIPSGSDGVGSGPARRTSASRVLSRVILLLLQLLGLFSGSALPAWAGRAARSGSAPPPAPSVCRCRRGQLPSVTYCYCYARCLHGGESFGFLQLLIVTVSHRCQRLLLLQNLCDFPGVLVLGEPRAPAA